jgi:hypothetical protein
MLRKALHALGFSVLCIGALGFVYMVGVAVATAILGVAIVRADLVALIFGIYWIVGPPLAIGVALWFAFKT